MSDKHLSKSRAAPASLVGRLGAMLLAVGPGIFCLGYTIGTGSVTSMATFRVLAGVACVVGLTVPVLGANPILAQIATQVANVFVLPLVIAGITYLINRKETMGPHRAGPLLNLGLAAAFVFSCVISWTGIVALRSLL